MADTMSVELARYLFELGRDAERETAGMQRQMNALLDDKMKAEASKRDSDAAGALLLDQLASLQSQLQSANDANQLLQKALDDAGPANDVPSEVMSRRRLENLHHRTVQELSGLVGACEALPPSHPVGAAHRELALCAGRARAWLREVT